MDGEEDAFLDDHFMSLSPCREGSEEEDLIPCQNQARISSSPAKPLRRKERLVAHSTGK